MLKQDKLTSSIPGAHRHVPVAGSHLSVVAELQLHVLEQLKP